MIRALACDIDGTITDHKRRIDLRAVKLLRGIEGLGIPVVLATGNVLCLTEAASIYIGTTGPLIAENGGVVREPGKKKNNYFFEVEKVEVGRAFDHLSGALPVRKVRRSDLRRTEIAIYRDFDIGMVRNILKDYNVRVVDTKFAIHITNPKVNKGAALEEVARLMELKVMDFAAIGDSENDFEMLQKAGLGIAVGDEKLRDVADLVTKEGFAEGGVAALEYLITEIEKDIKTK
jgi:phosphoglycolate phosphatase (TIGR01487 family)